MSGDVELEQVGPFLDPQFRELLGCQVGELVARLVDRVDLQLLLGLVGNLTRECDAVRERVGVIEDGRDGDTEITIGPDPKRRACRSPRCRAGSSSRRA